MPTTRTDRTQTKPNQTFSRRFIRSFAATKEAVSFRYSTEGIHNLRHAGQMWPAKAFNLTRKAKIYVYFA